MIRPWGVTLTVLFSTAVCGANPFVRDLAEEGNLAYRQEEYSKAASEYLKAQEIEPLSAKLHYNLGASYFQQEEFEKAMEEFQEATRADDPGTAAGAHYNLGNARYRAAKRDFEAESVASTGGALSEGEDQANPVQTYVGKLENCIKDYEESLKLNPEDADAKYNLEMIRREIKNLMRRNPEQQQQQEQQQDQDQQDQQDQQGQEQQQQQQQSEQEDQQQPQDQQQQQGQDQESEEQPQDEQEQQEGDQQGTPTPQPEGQPQQEQGDQQPTPQPAASEQNPSDQQPQAEPTQMMSISEEMARNLLENLPEQRPRQRRPQRRSVDKDW